MNLPPMGVTIYGRPQGGGTTGAPAKLGLTVHHPGGGRVEHLVNLWDHGDQLAHDWVTNGDRNAKGMLADWVDENHEHLQSIPPEYRQYVGQLIRRGHRYPPEPPVQMSRRKQPTPISPRADAITSPETLARYGRRAQSAIAGIVARVKALAPTKRRMMRLGDPNTHDAMIRQIAETRDPQALGPFADFLEEQGAPGAQLARRAWENSRHPEELEPPFNVNLWWEGDSGPHMWTGENGEDTQTTLSNAGNMEIRSAYNKTTKRGRLYVLHPPQTGIPTKQTAIEYNVPVESVEDLHHLTSDLPEPMRARIVQHLEPHLRRDEPEQMSRSLLQRRKYAAYRAPAGGMVVRGSAYKGGEMVPDMQGAFANGGGNAAAPVRKQESADSVNTLPAGPNDQSDNGAAQKRVDVMRRIAARRKRKKL